MLWCCKGTAGRREEGSSAASLRALLAATRRCFLDFAIGKGYRLVAPLLFLLPTRRDRRSDSPYSSPASASPDAPALSFRLSKSPQSHSGYSWSSLATGPSFPFIYPRPLRIVPAAVPLFGTDGVVSDVVDCSEEFSGEEGGEVVNGVEKGWAEVEVTGGGDSGSRVRVVKEKNRSDGVWKTGNRARRRRH